MNLEPAIAAQIAGRLIRVSVLVYIASDPPVRAWFGIGDLDHEPDAVDTEGGIYKGVGELIEVPAIQQMVNGAAQRVELAVSGVSDRIVQLADADAESIRSKRVVIGYQFFEEDWQPLGATIWLSEFESDVIRTETTSASSFQRLRSVSLSLGSIMTGRRRPKLSFFTRAQQRRRSPDDAFCDRTGLYSAETEIKWPPN